MRWGAILLPDSVPTGAADRGLSECCEIAAVDGGIEEFGVEIEVPVGGSAHLIEELGQALEAALHVEVVAGNEPVRFPT